jgi:hypothetical protein
MTSGSTSRQQQQGKGKTPEGDAMHGTTAPALLIDTESRAWRRRLGPVAWVVLEELALSAHRMDDQVHASAAEITGGPSHR